VDAGPNAYNAAAKPAASETYTETQMVASRTVTVRFRRAITVRSRITMPTRPMIVAAHTPIGN
jgi:head-tail adaptor